VGSAGWIIEAFHAWSDLRDVPFEDRYTPEQLLTGVMLYLVTDAIPTSTWIYGAKRHEEATLPPGRRVEVPTAVAAFRGALRSTLGSRAAARSLRLPARPPTGKTTPCLRRA